MSPPVPAPTGLARHRPRAAVSNVAVPRPVVSPAVEAKDLAARGRADAARPGTRAPFGEDVATCETTAESLAARGAAEHAGGPRPDLAALAAELPGALFALDVGGAGNLSFAFLSARASALWRLDPLAVCQNAAALLDRMEAAEQKSFMGSLMAAQRTDSTWSWEGRLLADGHFVWLQAVAQPMARATDHGGTTRFVGLFLDATARQQQARAMERALADAQEALAREQQRSASLAAPAPAPAAGTDSSAEQPYRGGSGAIQRLALGLAHEINNPLAGILYMFERLGEPDASGLRQETTQAIRAGLLRIQQSVHGLLQYAQPAAPRAEPVDWHALAATAAELTEPALRERGQTLSTELGEAPLAAKGDRLLLIQALMNVVLNASHAAPPHSVVSLNGACAAGRVGLRVCDSGHGIPREYLHRVCEPFFTTKQEGNGVGLGLATSSRIMEVHHGSLEIESQEGRGTCVTLWLPALPAL